MRFLKVVHEQFESKFKNKSILKSQFKENYS